MTVCCCGTEIQAEPVGYKVRLSPCRCRDEGRQPHGSTRQLRLNPTIPEYCFRQQYEERTRLGLPLETDTEKAMRRRWT